MTRWRYDGLSLGGGATGAPARSCLTRGRPLRRKENLAGGGSAWCAHDGMDGPASPKCKCCRAFRQADQRRAGHGDRGHRAGPGQARVPGARGRRGGASLRGLRSSNCSSHAAADLLPGLAQRMSAVAPTTSNWRKRSLPALLIRPRRCLPPVECSFAHGQAAALAQARLVGGPVRHPVPLPRDVMAAVLVQLEGHSTHPGIRRGGALLRRPADPRTTVRPGAVSMGTGRHLLRSHTPMIAVRYT